MASRILLLFMFFLLALTPQTLADGSREGSGSYLDFEKIIEQTRFKRIGLKAGMLIESPLLPSRP